jgi:hypothetical protein
MVILMTLRMSVPLKGDDPMEGADPIAVEKNGRVDEVTVATLF